MNQNLRKSVYRKITKSIRPYLKHSGEVKSEIHGSIEKAVRRFVHGGKVQAWSLSNAIRKSIRKTVEAAGLASKSIYRSIIRVLQRYMPAGVAASALVLATGDLQSAEPAIYADIQPYDASSPRIPVTTVAQGTTVAQANAVAQANSELYRLITQVQNENGNEDLDFALLQRDSRGGWFVRGEALYLQPVVSDLHSAIFQGSDDFSTSDTYQVNDAQLITAKPGYDAGYRVAVGWEAPGSGQAITVTYSGIQTRDTTSFVNPDTNNFYLQPSIFVSNANYSFANAVFSSYDLNYHVVDFDLTQDISVGSDMTIRILGGMRYANIDHQLDTQFTGSSYVSFSATTPDHTLHQTNFWAIGPRMGAELKWDIGGYGWTIYGGAHAALLAGNMDIHIRYDNSNRASGYDSLIDFKTSQNVILPVLDANVGIGYEGDWATLRLGYQFEAWGDAFAWGRPGAGWPAQNTMLTRKDFGMHGAFLSLEFHQ